MTLDTLVQRVRELDPDTEAELLGIEDRVLDENGQPRFTLADAIRLGSQVTGQLRGGWYNENEACALSAALIATRARL